ncbi:UNVERIFIED_CONTAM: hypothetical protein Slati_2967000 [Sesamum latifolium]|uniref:Reverse transcriptase RNase H-like domain-containing protein n=1 Tax=Sesamum latifolium TaxID=2727402 RepID=A0AAW2VI85_9LAMI
MPIYYVSKVLNNAEGWYTPIEKMALALVITARRLRPYFLSHPIGLIQIPREENIKVDCISKLASALEDCRTRHVTIQYLPKARTPVTIQAITSAEDWRMIVIRWLEEGHLPDNRWEAAKLKARAVHFLLQGGPLQKILFTPSTSMFISTRRSTCL